VLCVFQVKTEELSLDGIRQYYMDCKSLDDKYKALTEIFSLLEIGQSIIFVHVRNTSYTRPHSVVCQCGSSLALVASRVYPVLHAAQTVATAKLLANRMRADGYTVSLLHGKDMLPQERDQSERQSLHARAWHACEHSGASCMPMSCRYVSFAVQCDV